MTLPIGFFDALADAGEQAPAWGALCAGLAVLRVAEPVLGEGSCVSLTLLALARSLVHRMPRGPLRTTLTAALAIVVGARDADVEQHANILCGRLMAYGLALHAEGHFGPACDVFRAVEGNARRRGDAELALQALHRQAFALRLAHRLDEAEAAYQAMAALATAAGSLRFQLEAAAGHARLTIARGDFPRAEREVEAVIAAAGAADCELVLWNAMTDRALVAGVRGDPAGVVTWSYRALEILVHRADRERALLNMAIALRELGRAPASARIAVHLADRAQDADQRAFAALHCLHLAADAQDETAFARYRKRLARAPLTPVMSAEFYEVLARWSMMAGARDEATVALDRMLAISEQHRLAEHLVRADQALADVRRGRIPAIYQYRPAVVPPAATSEPVEAAVAAIDRLCPM